MKGDAVNGARIENGAKASYASRVSFDVLSEDGSRQSNPVGALYGDMPSLIRQLQS
jgi:hypothetical protein